MHREGDAHARSLSSALRPSGPPSAFSHLGVYRSGRTAAAHEAWLLTKRPTRHAWHRGSALALLQPVGVRAPQHPGRAHAAWQLLPVLAPDHEHLRPQELQPTLHALPALPAEAPNSRTGFTWCADTPGAGMQAAAHGERPSAPDSQERVCHAARRAARARRGEQRAGDQRLRQHGHLANSAYALTGISGDAASAKSAAAVAAPAAIMACAPPPPSSQRYAVRRTLGPHAWTGGTRMCRHLADSTCGSLGLMLCSCSCRAVFLPGEAAGRARRRGALANVGDARGQRGRDQRLHQRLHVRVKVQEGILAADAEQQVESAQLQRAKVGHLRTPSRARPAGPPRAARVGRAACSQRSALLPLASGCGSTTLAASACGSRDTGPRMRSRQVTGMGSLALILRQGDTTSASRTCLQKHQGPSSHRAPLCEVAALVSAVHDPSLPGGPHAGPSGPARPVRARPRCRLHAPRAVPGTQSSRTDARVGWR